MMGMRASGVLVFCCDSQYPDSLEMALMRTWFAVLLCIGNGGFSIICSSVLLRFRVSMELRTYCASLWIPGWPWPQSGAGQLSFD